LLAFYSQYGSIKKRGVNMITELATKFNKYQQGECDGLTLQEVETLLAAEDHPIFIHDHWLYRDIMDYRDHLEMEATW
jgi:hypothetical protein